VNNSDATAKARQFAETAYNSVVETKARDLAQKSGEIRNKLAARGSVLSGQMSYEMAALYGEHIKSLTQARLDLLVEGYELHGVPFDEQVSTCIIEDVSQLRSSLIKHTEVAVRASPIDRGPIDVPRFIQMVEQQIGGLNSIRTQLDRKRLMKKPEPTQSTVTNVYHVYGHNPRWNVNSRDQSVNVVTISNEQIFAELRQKLRSSVPAGDEQKDILEKLTALEAAQGSPSFAHRYADFIGAAANHMTLLAPFIPALAEMLSKALG
jgi:hypothetical protein